jgi:hypothetical protein
LFETDGPQYDWLNRIIAVDTGDRHPDGPIYTFSRCYDSCSGRSRKD